MRLLLLSLFCATALAACAGDPPTVPEPAGHPASRDLRPLAFRVQLDLDAGTATVRPPGATAGSTSSDRLAPSRSLLGGEVIRAGVDGGIVCTQISKNPNVKRCTFVLNVGNRLQSSDLMTPTDFPRPPLGTTGVLVFPFAAASDGTGGWAEPSSDWDLGPVNFFNDASSCANGIKTDCFRYEVLAAPLYGRANRDMNVGFDVPGDTKNLSVDIVVAADLRDNPLQITEIKAEPTLCGYVTSSGDVFVNSQFIEIGVADSDSEGLRGFCSFPNPLPLNARVEQAALLLFPPAAPVIAEPLDYGTTLDASDYWLPSTAPLPAANVQCCFGDRMWSNELGTVINAVKVKPAYFQYRFQSDRPPGEIISYYGTGEGLHKPKMEIHWRLP